jgi:hypothetical protein
MVWLGISLENSSEKKAQSKGKFQKSMIVNV